jgi:hypothetical protein
VSIRCLCARAKKLKSRDGDICEVFSFMADFRLSFSHKPGHLFEVSAPKVEP